MAMRAGAAHASAPARLFATVPGPQHRQLLGLLALAVLVRAGVALCLPSIDHPDQLYQASEQAHRLLYGYGVLPWEFRVGARSWLMPGLAAAVIGPAGAIVGVPRATFTVLPLVLGLLSLTTVWAAYRIGRAISPTHALIAGFVAAVWFEFVYFGVCALTEPLAASALLAAIAILTTGARTPRAPLLGGALLGLAFIFRFHLAPALLLVAVWHARRDGKSWLLLAAGASGPVALLGVLDWVSWGYPFASIVTNFEINAFEARSRLYGVAQPFAYLSAMGWSWGLFLFLSLPLIGLGARRQPLLATIALLLLGMYSLVAHKEYRFIFPALACLILLAALGSADLALMLRRPLKARWEKRLMIPVVLVLWAGASLGLGAFHDFRESWVRGRPWIEAFGWLAQAHDLCGLGLFTDNWSTTPGYSGLHRNVPLYPLYLWRDNPAALQEARAAANYVAGEAGYTPDLTGAYDKQRCFSAPFGEPTVCLYKRAGACRPAPDRALNAMLVRIDQ